MARATLSKTLVFKAVALSAGLGLGMLSYPVYAAPASGGDTVKGLYEVLLTTMKNGRILGQSGRFTQLDPVIRRSFDVASMARLSVGPSWSGLSEAQRQEVTESYGRYISAISLKWDQRFESAFLQRRVRFSSGQRSCARKVPRRRGALRMGGDVRQHGLTASRLSRAYFL